MSAAKKHKPEDLSPADAAANQVSSPAPQSEAAEDPMLISPPQRPASPFQAPGHSEPEFATASRAPNPSPEDAAPLQATAESASVASNRLQPIPPPSEPMQFRAIGLVEGHYRPSEDRFNRGTLIDNAGVELDAVLLGQVMSLVKKYVDLDRPYLWVVYPRTREKERLLHLQIVGVWAADGFSPVSEAQPDNLDNPEAEPNQGLFAPLGDGYFSVRGQVVYQADEKGVLFVKIQQAPKKSQPEAKSFKLRIEGTLPQRAVGFFWDLHVQRQAGELILQSANLIGAMPIQKRKRPSGRPGQRSDGRPKPPLRPSRNQGSAQGSREARSVPKPIKRKQPSAES